MKRMTLIAALMISLPLFVGTPRVNAQDQPSQGVGRVSLINGDVSTRRGDSGEWVATTVNAPLVQGDSIATGQRSRTGVQLDYANILRLAPNTEAKIADLERGRIQVQVATGLVNFTVLKGTEADVEIDSPNMAVHPRGPGVYRIQVNSPTDTQVIVRKGEADVSTQQGSTTVASGQMIYVQGSDNPEYKIADATPKDEWDEWNRDRDRHIEEAQSYRYTNRYYTGADDLDRYGHWQEVPDYGWCWTPYVNAGWVPYADGRWVWEPYWGWTWVSYEPWGWAPYHYGRWFWYGNSWAWWPGYVTPVYYPVWAPAYVSFLGFGFGGGNWGFGFGFGFGSIGWCPLGPADPFYPWWGYGNSYNVVNITNITNVTNVTNVNNTNIYNHILPGRRGRIFASNLQGALTNDHIRRGITMVSARDFADGRIPRNRPIVGVDALRQGSVVKGTLPVVPTRASLRPIDRPVNRGALPRVGTDRFFATRPAPAPPRPFTERASEIQRMVQTHNPVAAVNREPARWSPSATNRPTPGAARTTAGASGEGRGFTPRAGTPSRATQPNPTPGNAGERGGWQRFAGRGRPAPGAGPSNVQSSHAPSVGRGNWPGTINTQGRNNPPSRVQTHQPDNRGGWQRFSSQPRPTNPPQGGRTFAAPRSESAAPGWNRFEPRPSGNAPARSGGWNAPAPRGQTNYPSRSGSAREWGGAPRGGYQRAPLELRRPIVRERSYEPRSYGGGSGRTWSAPSGGGRTWSAPSGGGRSYSAPSGGGGRSAPAPRSSGGGGRRH